MKTTTDPKLITCILRKGKAKPLMEALNEKGHVKLNFAFARGSDLDEVLSSRGKLKEEEKEIVTVVVDDPDRAEETFDYIFEIAEINEPGAGLIYMTSLTKATAYSLG